MKESQRRENGDAPVPVLKVHRAGVEEVESSGDESDILVLDELDDIKSHDTGRAPAWREGFW